MFGVLRDGACSSKEIYAMSKLMYRSIIKVIFLLCRRQIQKKARERDSEFFVSMFILLETEASDQHHKAFHPQVD